MNSNYIFSKRIIRLDKNVLLTMFLFIITSSVFLSYTVLKENKTAPCKAMDVYIFGQKENSKNIYNINKPVLFRIYTSASDEVIWDFGDNSENEKGAVITHVFQQEKIFLVKATVNGRCSFTANVNIKKQNDVIVDSNGNTLEPIIGKAEAEIGDKVTFKTELKAITYKWSIENKSGYPTLDSKDATFNFTKSGKHTILLILNNDPNEKYRYDVSVKSNEEDDAPKPENLIIYNPPPQSKQEDKQTVQQPQTNISAVPEKKEEVKPAPSVSFKRIAPQQFRDDLQGVVCSGLEITHFDKYLCSGGETKVRMNDDNILIDFSKLYTKLKNDKKIKIDSVKVVRDDKNCVTLLQIWYDKKRRPCNN